ncbi:uncharacterized protein AMSG_00235 [Thecamonas trahens ATCC 50062]|uniref:DUF7630 domain-containing protein n=1 Tax=Thecamonas trahens ATCC 50062 TaxID=461836 RepID=A0A0L0D1K0_THETB|nr:hypothetical protein AMSG_00235 [Thecamonas trahens ATCC 50062]KNC46117.1 hypothetical protein AMSG_00235 [Thecamonas trahens ATCC 50062]|eukprot:XP_013763094.1 hypothetical protein AMSG_00235 [Thecamonas trahens ATCC 50062]
MTQKSVCMMAVCTAVVLLAALGVEAGSAPATLFAKEAELASGFGGRTRAIVGADVDGDGVTDVVVASVVGLMWIRLADAGTQAEVVPILSDNNVVGVAAGDLDGDGDVDLVVGIGVAVGWLENLGSVFSPLQTFNASFGATVALEVVDIDGDGELDVVAGASDPIAAVFFNAGSGSSWSQATVSTSIRISALKVADLNNDGDVDLFAALGTDDGVQAWLNNGDGSTWTSVNVASGLNLVTAVSSGDLDADGFVDLVSGSFISAQILLHTNVDGSATVWNTSVIEPSAFGSVGLRVTDVDGDGDSDVVLFREVTTGLAWLENVAGDGSVWSSTVVRQDVTVSAMNLVDVDGHGGLDIVFGTKLDNGYIGSFLNKQPAASQSALLNAAFLHGQTAERTEFVVDLAFADGTPAMYPMPASQVSVLFTPAVTDLMTLIVSGSPTQVVISVQFTVAQAYSMDISLFGEELPGSPFSVVVDVDCPPGFKVAGSQCVACEEGTYGRNVTSTVTECTQCPGLTNAPEASSSWRNCTCVVGTWLTSRGHRANAPCESCPRGATCLGGLSHPQSLPGFYEHPAGSGRFLECTRAGCLGNGRCRDGYTGFLCGTCQNGFYSLSDTECATCPKSANSVFVSGMAILIVVASLGGLFVAWSVTRVTKVNEAYTLACSGSVTSEQRARQLLLVLFRQRTLPVSLGMIVVAFQVVDILGSANFAWDSASSAVLSIFGAFSVNPQLVAAECAVATYHTLYVVSVATPIAMLGIALLVNLALRLAAHFVHIPLFGGTGQIPLRSLVDSVIFTLAPVLYIPIARAALALFDCVILPDGSIVLDSDVGVKCFDAKWWRIFPLGIVAIFGFVLGLPLYFAMMLVRKRTVLFELTTTLRFGSLYRNFRRHHYYGEVLSLCKRLAIVVVTTFLSRQQLVQIALLFGIFVAALYFVGTRQPYYFPLYNDLDVRLSVVLCAILLIGTGAYAERSSGTPTTAFSVATIVAVVSLVAVACHGFGRDVYLLWCERNATYVAAAHRRILFAKTMDTEMMDVADDDGLHNAAHAFLHAFETATSIVADKGGRADASDFIALDMPGGLELDNI